MYTYCANNPIHYVDASGHWGISISWLSKAVSVATKVVPFIYAHSVIFGTIAVVVGGWSAYNYYQRLKGNKKNNSNKFVLRSHEVDVNNLPSGWTRKDNNGHTHVRDGKGKNKDKD